MLNICIYWLAFSPVKFIIAPMKTIEKDSLHAWLICLPAALFFFTESVRVNLFDTVAPALMQHFHVNAYRFSELSAIYLLSNIIFIFPAGIILDKIQTRYVLLSALTITITATFGFYHSQNFAWAKTLMFITGIGGACCFVSTMRLASQWFSPKKLALATGLIVTSGMVGGLFAQLPMSSIINYFGHWQAAYQFIMSVEIILAILVFVLVRNNRQQWLSKNSNVRGFLNNITAALKHPATWLAGLYTSLLNLPITLLGAIWGQLYLTQVFKLSQISAATITSFLFFGVMIGSPLYGYISDHIRSRRKPMVVGALSSLIIILMIMLNHHSSIILLCSLFFSLGLLSSSQVLGYTIVSESSSTNINSTSMGIASVLVMCGGTFLQPYFGWILKPTTHSALHPLVTYSSQSFFYALLIFPIAFALSLIIIKFLPESHEQ